MGLGRERIVRGVERLLRQVNEPVDDTLFAVPRRCGERDSPAWCRGLVTADRDGVLRELVASQLGEYAVSLLHGEGEHKLDGTPVAQDLFSAAIDVYGHYKSSTLS